MLMNTLDRYIGKSILGAIFATLFTLGWSCRRLLNL